jgi:hypothetical protein
MLMSSQGLLPCPYLFHVERVVKCYLLITASNALPNQLSSKSKICWCSIDVHFQVVTDNLLLARFPITVANRLIIDNCKQIASQLTFLQDQQLLMLHWHSLLESHSNIISCVVAINGSQYLPWKLMLLHSHWIFHDAWLQIRDSSSLHIVRW